MYQSLLGPNYGASYVATTAEVARSLGRPLAGNVSTVTIDLIQPLSQFLDQRINQLDIRLTKILKIPQRGRFQLNFDIYNFLNDSAVLWINQTYIPAANWLRPTSTLDARLIKFGAQYDF